MPDDTANTTNGVSRQELNVESVNGKDLLTNYQENNPDALKLDYLSFLPALEKDKDLISSEGSTGDTDSATAGTTASGQLTAVIEQHNEARFIQMAPFDYNLQLLAQTPEMKQGRANTKQTKAQEERQ